MGAPKLEDNLINKLKSLHLVLTKNYHNEEDLFDEYLAIGKEIFHLETGIVSRIEDNTYKVLSFSSPLEGLEKDQIFSLEDTYCREVYEAKKTVAFPHVGADKKMCNHPVYINMKLESYISSPIFVNGEIYGTINFTDRSVRIDGFSANQYELIEIMAKTISRFIEAKIMKDSLKDANHLINRLVGVVAHDLKNPLGNILALTELIEDETKEPQTKEYINLIKSSSESSLEMIGSILEMSAIECGKIIVEKKSNSISSVIKSSWSEVSHVADKKEILCEINGSEGFAEFDYDRLKQVFCNLFTNAIKFSPIKSVISVEWEFKRSGVVISVIDSGVGMNEKQIKFAFDPTKATSTNGTEGETGTGYGLPLVAQLVSHHGGTIQIESSKAAGTKFIIELPVR